MPKNTDTDKTVKTSDFDYALPPELIAQTPTELRDRSRLMVLSRADGSIQHQAFFQVTDFLRTGDVLVLNDSRVIPARLAGRKIDSGGRLDILLLRRLGPDTWETLVRPASRARIGTRMRMESRSPDGKNPECVVRAEVVGLAEGGKRVLTFSDVARLTDLGEVPLPPYIHMPLANPERYQTVYAVAPGSVAAPTAGLHFTTGLLKEIEGKGVRCLKVTLHVGLDTFQPVREENPLEHPIHREYGMVSPEVAGELSRARAEGRRIICVGTTSVRLVEAAARASGKGGLAPFAGWVDLFITPGYRFLMADAVITNFHLPRSTTLMLVTAFAGKGLIDRAYQEAIAKRYRFYSFGDAILIL